MEMEMMRKGRLGVWCVPGAVMGDDGLCATTALNPVLTPTVLKQGGLCVVDRTGQVAAGQARALKPTGLLPVALQRRGYRQKGGVSSRGHGN